VPTLQFFELGTWNLELLINQQIRREFVELAAVAELAGREEGVG
jgi:hypothetical protein